MEVASWEALDKNTCSYKYFSMVIKQMTQIAVKKDTEKIIIHDNVRGSSAFVGDGINA